METEAFPIDKPCRFCQIRNFDFTHIGDHRCLVLECLVGGSGDGGSDSHHLSAILCLFGLAAAFAAFTISKRCGASRSSWEEMQ